MLSFAQFAEVKTLNDGMKRAFEMHIRWDLAGNFNFRTLTEWDRLLTQFHMMDRRRHA